MAALPEAMKPVKFNLEVYQGADYTRTLTFKVGDPSEAADFTGCSARAQVRPTIQSKTVLLDMTTTNGRLSLGAGGTLSFDLREVDTNALPAGDAVYDLELVYPSGRVRRLLYGTVSVSPGVTRG